MRVVRRGLAVAAIGCAVYTVGVAPVGAVEPPTVLVDSAPPDGPPGPELPTKQSRQCVPTGALANSDLSKPPPPSVTLNLTEAHRLSRGAGVTVAVVDTGAQPNRRFQHLTGGGDYVTAGGDGLSDCDAHGTMVAGIIGANESQDDGFVGVAPDAGIVSIRYRSGAFEADRPGNYDDAAQRAAEIRTLARAIVHAANLGAGVIAIPLPLCVDANLARTVDQSALSAAVGYAVQVRNAVVLAGAGDTGTGCQQNPDVDPVSADDPRNWNGVNTISTPGWFVPDVLTVGATTAIGAPLPESLAGPWVGIGAPGTAVESIGPDGKLVNGVGTQLQPFGGSSYATAYVAGVAALLRSRFPAEKPDEIVARLRASAHSPARGLDNSIGAGVIDPVAALGYRTAPAPPDAVKFLRPLEVPDPAPVDDRPRRVTGAIMAGVVVCGLGAATVGRLRRRSR